MATKRTSKIPSQKKNGKRKTIPTKTSAKNGGRASAKSSKTSTKMVKRTSSGQRAKTKKPSSERPDKQMAKVASRVVHQAASILEEEIARGIIAAKEVEERYINVNEIRDAESDDIVQRFRVDAHELVDIIIDLVHVTVRSLGRVISLEAGVKPSLPAQTENGTNGREIVSIKLPGPIEAGEHSEASITLTNSDKEPTPPFTFRTLGLVNTNGDMISPKLISFQPEQLTIQPNGSAPLKVQVEAPENTPPGLYTGLLQSTHLEKLCATLSIEVV